MDRPQLEKYELKKLLQDYLTIEINEREDMYQKDIEIVVNFDGEEICSASYNVERKNV